jgi:enterochelin esterase-like enzyme
MKNSFHLLTPIIVLFSLSLFGCENKTSSNEQVNRPVLDAFRSPFLEIEYNSVVTNHTKHAFVYLPYDFEEGKKYPVLYLLHGVGEDHKDMMSQVHMEEVSGKYQETSSTKFITVCVNLNMNENEEKLTLKNKSCMDDSTKDIVSSLMPYINEHFPTKDDKESNYICGISYGGRVALQTALNYPELFSKAGALEPWKLQTGAIEKNKDTAKNQYFYIQQGTKDFLVFDEPTKISEKMNAYEISNTLVTTSYGHTYDAWREGYKDFLGRIF